MAKLPMLFLFAAAACGARSGSDQTQPDTAPASNLSADAFAASALDGEWKVADIRVAALLPMRDPDGPVRPFSFGDTIAFSQGKLRALTIESKALQGERLASRGEDPEPVIKSAALLDVKAAALPDGHRLASRGEDPEPVIKSAALLDVKAAALPDGHRLASPGEDVHAAVELLALATDRVVPLDILGSCIDGNVARTAMACRIEGKDGAISLRMVAAFAVTGPCTAVAAIEVEEDHVGATDALRFATYQLILTKAPVRVADVLDDDTQASTARNSRPKQQPAPPPVRQAEVIFEGERIGGGH